MALLQNSNLSILKLGYNNFGDEGINTLAVGISAHRALGSLDLGFNQVGDEGIRSLAAALFGSALHTLYLAGNHMGEEGAMALADGIRRGCAVTKLHLTGNRLGPDGVKAITEAILEDELRRRETSYVVNDTRGIQELFLGGTSMGPMGCHAVATMLSRSRTIRVISMANCGITDDEVATLAVSIKENRELLPLEALQLSFNAITCKGLDLLTNAIWGSQIIRELLLDNNEIGDRGAQQIANILPYVKTLEVLDVGFNGIKSQGMKALMKVVAETQHLVSLSVSGNPIDTGTAKAVAYALAYNQSLKCLFLDHCDIQHEGQRHIVAGFVSNCGIMLRKLTGFRIGRKYFQLNHITENDPCPLTHLFSAAVIVTIELPSALEHWTNEQVLNFIHLMWEQSNQSLCVDTEELEVDPLQFLPDPSGEVGRAVGPLDASTVVEVAKRAYASLGETGYDVFSRHGFDDNAFDSPLTEDAIMVEGADGDFIQDTDLIPTASVAMTGSKEALSLANEGHLSNKPMKSFVAVPAKPAKPAIPDPHRKKRIVDWLCKNIQHLNELSQIAFNSGELWRLHQHYFTPVVNESGGNVNDSSLLESADTVGRMVNSVPDVSRHGANPNDASMVTPSTQSIEDQCFIPASDPSLQLSPMGVQLTMLKRKVSYRFLGDADKPTGSMHYVNEHSVAKMIEDGAGVQAMPPRTKRARRNKTRISFLPRIKAKLESYLDVCHEKALILMRQLYFVEHALLAGKINPNEPSGENKVTHLFGLLADEAEMILIDMV
jgi:Ran GTPase-activating protein (RanGAP) involved in mRNA processing and transport